MRKTRAVLTACLLMAATATALADRGGFTIRDFDVELIIEPNAELLVEERLVVDFSEPRHGIYRAIPVRYTDPRGYLYSLGFRLIEVVDENGEPHEARVSREGRYVNVRIGHPDRTVEGRVTYVLRYRVRDAVAHFAQHDELYWNVTGNEWQSSIESASARVHLPGPVERDALEAIAYTGVLGSREQDARISFPGASVISYESSETLEPLEGLTLVATWPHGLVQFPGRPARTARFLGENWIVLFPLLALGCLTHRYWTAGRDPEGPASVMVRYEPPPDLRPGEIGALVDERVDLQDLTATVVDLAIRGYLRIRVDEIERLFGLWNEEETWFERTERSWDDLREYERAVLSGLFAHGDVVSTEDLERKFYRHVPGIEDAVWEDLVQRRYLAGKPNSVRRRWKILGLGVGALTLGIGYAWARYRGAVFPHALLAPLLSAGVVALLFAIFSRGMPRRTRRGVAFKAWARGFEEFVDRVERDAIDEAQRRNVFEGLLPYAMALGIAAAWARRFEGIYAAAPPLWFHGRMPASGFSTSSFERTLSSAMARAGTGMTTAPRSQGSSGAGGGGFSGGGGGGGGGGSW